MIDENDSVAPLLTVPTVSRYLGTSEPRTYELIRSGELVAVRLGPRRIRVRPADLDAYLERHLTTTGGAA